VVCTDEQVEDAHDIGEGNEQQYYGELKPNYLLYCKVVNKKLIVVKASI